MPADLDAASAPPAGPGSAAASAAGAAAGPGASAGAPRGRRAARVSGDERESAILTTADRLLGEKDFSALTIDDLARGAGISRPTFYFYFASKRSVLLALLDRVAREASRRSAEVFTGLEDDPAATWRRVIAAFFDTFAQHPGVVSAVVGARGTDPELVEQWSRLLQGWIDETAAAIERERTRGAAVAGPDPRVLATSLNLLNERVIMAALTEPSLPAAAVDPVDTLLHVWLSSIYGVAGPAR
ncbi:TetR family transcriptional regulator [Frigoribacterium sp. PhB160]|uniref:TetR/AcrR family transcriptional regulator n=1 Tax=Frigoribacterium sp. PhB160 TaxID=2485192 RepID=UPI000F46EB80|nr:TetR/AcrR family transcriptional regulator [Frigoribacterium sp. PhB160]ROS58264.1 TetR family transcriptional regulator [Frigoribacterium sp. PhB160]